MLMIIKQNILTILRIFLNLKKKKKKKKKLKNFIPSKVPQLLLLNFLAKLITERKYLMNTLIFVRRKHL